MENSLVFISSEHYLFDRLNATYLNGIYFDGMTQDHFNYDCCGVIQGSIRPGIFDCRILDYPNLAKHSSGNTKIQISFGEDLLLT